MSLAVICPFYGRHESAFPLLHRLFIGGTAHPTEVHFVCEEEADQNALLDAYRELFELELLDDWPKGLIITRYPTPMNGNAYAEIPYSRKINLALDTTGCDLITYLDNGSMPDPLKYETMVAGLESHPEWGAVYCGQKRTGMHELTCQAQDPVEDAYCGLNFTQVMHRKTTDRWPVDMRHANPDLADGLFWRSLHASLGVFFPVGIGRILDEHHIPNASAQGC